VSFIEEIRISNHYPYAYLKTLFSCVTTNRGVKQMIVDKCIIVEGRSDKLNIAPIFAEDVKIICTNGTISEDALLDLLEPFEECKLYTLFDADNSGEKLRKLTKRIYSEAVHLFIPRTYIEVANAPKKVLANLLSEAKFSVHKQYLSSSIEI